MEQSSDIILAIVDDMFFASKIRAAATAAGRAVTFVKSIPQLESEAADKAPSLVIIDLDSDRTDPIQVIKQLKSTALASVPIVGFLSHVHVELKRTAEAAGCDYVLPRSAFAARLSELLAGNLEG